MSGYKKTRISKLVTKDTHRFVMERILGRPLLSSEIVHHKNHDKSDNRPENLEVMSRADHSRLHVTKQQIDRVRVIGRSMAKPLIHGTVHGYDKRACRCDECRNAANERRRKNKRLRRMRLK